MINGKSDAQYWHSLIGAPKDDEQVMKQVAQTMKYEGHEELAEEYFERHQVAATHNDIVRSLGYLVEKRSDSALNEGSMMAGKLIWEGWKPPPGLMLTKEGRDLLSAKGWGSDE